MYFAHFTAAPAAVQRYLDYEKKHGTPAGVEHVKRRALEYVEAAAAGTGA